MQESDSNRGTTPAPEAAIGNAVLRTPNGHLKLPHLWPPKLPQARRVDYASAVGPVAMRWASARIL